MKLKKVILNTVALIILVALLVLVTAAKPYRRGFWCSDETIKYKKQKETVDVKQLALLCALLPFIVIIITEIVASKKVEKLILSKLKKQNNRRSSSEPESSFWANLGSVTYSWFFTLSLTALITGVIKVQVGRLRPVFYLMCLPDVSCSDPVNQGVYLTNYTCTAANESTENFIRSSFPSGHTSYTISSMLFLIIYYSKRFNVDKNNDWRFLIALIQTGFLSIALYVGLSRVADNIHHWQDVLGGFIIGVVVTLVCACFLDHFNSSNEEKSDQNDSKSKVDYPERLETF
ncbi:phospholipid phosphatase 1-like [Tetranychus urticae]|uniref:Phosphatidic acid phosphatase type 2/haloperoxidase domain-containing protein n=1 Tax=Tetranychus urticae TaxID=32264 RepID=T1KSR1_TETUR|nr:phospholipid phosphatase 1-like [Tetranychus urticae]